MVKNLPANAGDTEGAGSIPGSERALGKGDGNPLQYSCLGNSMDRGVWQATVHGVTVGQNLVTKQQALLYPDSEPINCQTFLKENLTFTIKFLNIHPLTQ